MKDPIVEAIREIRRKHAERFNYDIKAICSDLKEKEKESGHELVSLSPKLLLKRKSD